jgi:hypothetical protein
MLRASHKPYFGHLLNSWASGPWEVLLLLVAVEWPVSGLSGEGRGVGILITCYIKWYAW